MYGASPFHEQESSELCAEVMRGHPFATLIVTQDNLPVVTHLPLMLDAEAKVLRGHIARANPIAKMDLSAPHHCMAVFHGPDAYVSPAWYQTKKDNGKVVPTWNYVVVHVTGQLRLVSDRDWVLSAVTDLTNVHEHSIGSDWQVADAPASYVDILLKAIIGVELPIEAVTGKFKLSQNKSSADLEGVIAGLHGTERPEDKQVAEWMERVSRPKVAV